MDQIFDRLSKLFRSMNVPDDSDRQSRHSAADDPDLKAAEEELDEFLRTGKNQKKATGQGPHSYQQQRQQSSTSRDDIDMQQAYLVLELTAGATWDQVKAQHKKLLMKYHPDRHAGNLKAQQDATVLTQRINEAFQKIKKHLGR